MRDAAAKNPFWPRGECGRRAFTLAELLVVIGIIGVLMSALLVMLAKAWGTARTVTCASNLRQVTQALLVYAGDCRGAFPLNISSPAPARNWCDPDRIGRYLPGLRAGSGTVGMLDGVLVCPEDPNSRRSYSMNIWASSKVTTSPKTAAMMATLGQFWKASVRQPSQMILVTERWSSQGSTKVGWYYAPATLGLAGFTPGQRFGAGGGINPAQNAGRWGKVISELDYSRHRTYRGGKLTDPVGRVNIGYADGHVELKAEKTLADFETGLSTLDSMWSPMDPELNQ